VTDKDLFPRRGGAPVPPPAGAKDAVKKLDRLVASKVDDLAGSLANPATDPELRAAGDGSPLAAAVLAAKLLRRLGDSRVDTTVVADAWIAAHGPAFAAVAAAELAELRVGEAGALWRQRDEPIARLDPDDQSGLGYLPILARVRARLVADPSTAPQALAEVRAARGPRARAAAAFLLPQCTDWVEEAVTETTASAPQDRVELVLWSVGDAQQLARLRSQRWQWILVASDASMATVLDGVGSAALIPVLREQLGSLPVYRTDERGRAAAALAAMPDDDAFSALVAHAADPHVLVALFDAAQRSPQRAIRLLEGAMPELFEAYTAGYAGPPAGEAGEGEVPAPLREEPEPDLPGWADAAILPRIRLRDGRTLPVGAARRLVRILGRTRVGSAPAGLEEVVAACDRASLAAFGWALFQRWQSIGLPNSGAWAMHGLGWLGDDDVVRRLTPLIKVWPGTGGHHRSVAALWVLTTLGTDVALIHLNDVAEKVKFAGLRTSAQRMLHAVAGRRGLTGEQLADRLVPDLGLRADGGLVLDYGPRRFLVGFDDQLRPTVADETGKRLKSLPKPGARDDATLAPAAHQRFTALKKDVRTLAGDQILRFERAMVTARRWTAADFAAFVVGHPLVRHIARRLVWTSEAAGSVAFRVAEDGSYAGVDDDTLKLADDALVGVAHPLPLGAGAVARWAEVFADYELLQPFPQLSRETYPAAGLDVFEGRVVPSGRVLGLEKSGWRRATPQDNGHQPWIEHPLPDGLRAYVRLRPGFSIGRPGDDPEQTLSALFVARGRIGYGRRPEDEVAPGAVDPVAMSELLRDLHRLSGQAG
jgi:hypothetical protein